MFALWMQNIRSYNEPYYGNRIFADMPIIANNLVIIDLLLLLVISKRENVYFDDTGKFTCINMQSYKH